MGIWIYIVLNIIQQFTSVRLLEQSQNATGKILSVERYYPTLGHFLLHKIIYKYLDYILLL